MLKSATLRTPENLSSRLSERLISSTPLNSSNSNTKKATNARRRIVHTAHSNHFTSSESSDDDDEDGDDDDSDDDSDENSDDNDDDDEEENDDDEDDDDDDGDEDNDNDESEVDESNDLGMEKAASRRVCSEADFNESHIIGKQNFSSKLHSVATRNPSVAIGSRIGDTQATNSLQQHLGKNVRMSKEKQKFFRHSAFNSERNQKTSPTLTNSTTTNRAGNSHFGLFMELFKKWMRQSG